MLRGLIVVFMLVLAGCATTGNQQDMSVTCPNGELVYKKDFAPRDFPDELFAAYVCKRSRILPYDLDSDGINDIVWNTYYDKNNRAEAWWVLRILEPDGSKATTWAFIKSIDGVARIIWENKKIEKLHREWLRGVIELINESLAEQ